MQGSFEKKVQEKLDELKLNPSAPVWEKIEMQIQPEKKRRRGIFWIPVAVILLLGSGWWALQTNTGETTTTAQGIDHAITTTPTNEKKSLPTDQSPVKPSQKNNRTFEPHLTDSSTVLLNRPASSNLPLPAAKSAKDKQQGLHSNQQRLNGKTTLSAIETTSKDEPVKELQILEKPTGMPVEQNAAIVTGTDSFFLKKNEPVASTDSTTKDEKTEADKIVPVGTDTPAVKKSKIAAQQKWRKTIVVQGGFNNLSARASLAMADAMPNYTTSPGTTSSSLLRGANRVTSGISAGVGAGISRLLGEKWELAAVLQYTFHRLHTEVGTFRNLDTSLASFNNRIDVSGYYRNGTGTGYTINYHLLELPVSISLKPVSSVPLRLSAGASYGRLLTSNALTYSAAINGYYVNRENVTSDFFSAFSSLQYSLINRPGLELRLGPVVQYQFSSLQKQTIAGPVRLSFAGLKTAINF
jgi:hypothetical protein